MKHMRVLAFYLRETGGEKDHTPEKILETRKEGSYEEPLPRLQEYPIKPSPPQNPHCLF